MGSLFSTQESQTKHDGDVFSSSAPRGCIDLFFQNLIVCEKGVRKVDEGTLRNLIDKAYEESPLDTMKILFYIRDYKEGKGEKQIFRDAISYICHSQNQVMTRHMMSNFEHVPVYGTWKDFLYLSVEGTGNSVENFMLAHYAKQLQKDVQKTDGNISLAAKWAPTEGCHFDKKYDTVTKIIKHLKCSKKDYRKKYLVPLRKQLALVEEKMSRGEWDDIDYSKLPLCSLKIYTKAFKKHSPEKFEEYSTTIKKDVSHKANPFWDTDSKTDMSLTEKVDFMRHILDSPRYDRIV